MAEKSDAFFKELATRGYEPLLHRVTGTYEFDIAGARRWLVRVHAGELHVSELQTGTKRQEDTVDCKVVCSADDFDDFLQGKQDMMTALLQGRIQIMGDVAMAGAFQRIIGAAPLASVR